jgi:hypothetical protein
MRGLRLPFVTLLIASSAPALASDLKTCTTIDDAAARLACYDRAAGRQSAAAATTAAEPMRAATPESAHAATSNQFGAEQLRSTQIAKAQDTSTMQAHIVGTFDGWEPKSRFTLDNGQTWVVTDDRSAYVAAVQNPLVTIKKGLFGAYYLHVEGLNSSAKVKRLQ